MGCFDPDGRTEYTRKDCKGDFRRGEDGAFYLWSRQNSWARAWAWVKHARFCCGRWQRERATQGALAASLADQHALGAIEALAQALKERDLGRFRRRARRWLS